jgi:hypothetical protein
MCLSTSMIRRRILNNVPGFKVCTYEDYVFWKDCSKYSRALFLNKYMVFYDISQEKNYKTI